MSSLQPSLPPTMRAWAFSRRGPPASTLTLTSLPTPLPSSLQPDEVLIKVSHVGLNTGLQILFHLFPHLTSTPFIPEVECSGSIVAFGSKGASTSECEGQVLELNDEIVGFLDPRVIFKRNGALAEYAVIYRKDIVRKPANMSNAEAAGLLGCGWTAVCAGDAAGLKKGGKVLVNGASGALGSEVVQIARNLVGEEGKVVGVCSGKNEETVRGLGADEVSPSLSFLLEEARLCAGKTKC